MICIVFSSPEKSFIHLIFRSFSVRFSFNESNRPIFLEFDYKCNTDIEVGILGHLLNGTVATNYKLFVTEKPEWNKIYVNLTYEILTMNAIEYQIIFRVKKKNDNPVKVYLDNLKLLTFWGVLDRTWT